VYEETLRETARIQGARDNEVHWLRLAVESERDRANELQQVIFRKFGIIPIDAARPSEITHHEPISRTQAPWGKRRKQLEDEDLKRHLDNLERQYKGRSTAMPPGDSPSSDSAEHVPTSSQVGD
jgi:hypothetical protein